LRISNGSEAECVVCSMLMWCTADWTIPVAVAAFPARHEYCRWRPGSTQAMTIQPGAGSGGLAAGLSG
jgi:hypothetical protein